MSGLADRDLTEVPAGTPPLASAEIAKYRRLIAPAWQVVSSRDQGGDRLVRAVATADFSAAMALAARVATLAEQLQHHPELLIAWGRVTVTIWTHTTGGLTGNDFIFAAKLDALLAA